jgi:hypothetical protein
MSHFDVVPLEKLYGQCMLAFRNLLFCLNHSDLRASKRDPIPLDTMLEEFGRFKIWSEQTRIYQPARSRGSLDELVQDRLKTKRILVATLEQLHSLLKTGQSILLQDGSG